MKILAGIDIGSNAMRLIINEMVELGVGEYDFTQLSYLRLPIRLGGSVFTKGYIDEAKEKEFIKGMQIYKDLLEYFEVEKYRACATSAMRDAQNGEEVISKVKQICGLDIDVIDGVEEAELLFYINKNKIKNGEYYLSADLGGGSIQLSVFYRDKIEWTKSYAIGTVRMLNNAVNPLIMREYREEIQNMARKYPNINLIGTGGNINKISSMLSSKYVNRKDLERLYNELKPLSILDRMKKFGLRQDRADVIVYACEIFLEMMRTFKRNEIYVPKAGLADGIIYKLYEEEMNKISRLR